MKHAFTACAIAVALFAASPAPAQRSSPPAETEHRGVIDLNEQIERQITQLEQMVGGDASARKQTMTLQWLIELYGAVGRTEDVERCYERILTFYPNDVATLNNYGRYLMDTVGDLERADSVLYDANEWAKATDARSIDLGTTYQLRAELMRRRGEFDRSVRLADKALELIAAERTADILRTRAKSLEALGRYDEAAETWLRVIALERAANPEDINALKLMVSKTTKYRADDLQHYIDAAVTGYRKQYEARVELEGGEVTHFASTDGIELEGTLRRADGPGAVLFVHDLGGRRSEFTPYGQLLYIDGISSLAVDLRGHGGSRADSMLSYRHLSAYNLEQLPGDVVAAYRYLRDTLGLDNDHVAIVAAGGACAIVEKALYEGRFAAPVVHLSPSFPTTDVELRTALAFHRDLPALAIAAREDLSSLRAIDAFANSKPREQFTRGLYEDAGHGIETLRRVPDALETLQQWLRDVVGSS